VAIALHQPSTRWRARAVAVCGVVLGATVLLAGIAKIAGFREFAGSVETWTILPAWVRVVSLLAVPIAEVLVGATLLLSPSSRFAAKCVLAMIVVFSAVYIAQYVFVGPPKCGCFGLLSRYSSALEDSKIVLGRNALLIVIAVVSLVLSRSASASDGTGGGPDLSISGEPG